VGKGEGEAIKGEGGRRRGGWLRRACRRRSALAVPGGSKMLPGLQEGKKKQEGKGEVDAIYILHTIQKNHTYFI
jgi:hypothetical protein